MEQFRQIGEVMGSLNSMMIFQNNIFNQRQCCLLVDMLNKGYKTIAEQMKQNLKFEEKNTKWKIIEHPLKELLRIFKEGEIYIMQCLETKDWWAKAISLYQNSDCVEFHIHNLLTCIPIVIEAIEMTGEISGSDQDESQKKKIASLLKYQSVWKDPRIFQWKYGEQYLVSEDFYSRLESVWDEDHWVLLKKIQNKKNSGFLTSKQENRLAEILLRNLDSSIKEDKLLPSSTLVSSKDYQVRRRLGNGSQYKEIQWLGESFALRHFFGDIETMIPEISRDLTLSHPNILHAFCAFCDEEKKECFLLMELMNRDLTSYIKEICGPRRRIPFSLPVVVDIMLQIARGMEYLHSQKIYHGELNPYNVLVKARNASTDGYLHVKVSGFGLSPPICFTPRTPKNQNEQFRFIWYAPEVLEEQHENFGDGGNSKYSEKSDVYSFGMICFEVLTGKVPFEDTHLQGDKMGRNIRAGERPLFPFNSPKFITNLTKKCWHTDPSQRPSFSSICRILRHTKRLTIMNPEQSQFDPPTPSVDFIDTEAVTIKSSSFTENSQNSLSVSQIPFEMFAYKVTEKEKSNISHHQGYTSESGGSEASAYEDENLLLPSDEPFPSPTERKPSPSPENVVRRLSLSKKSLQIKTPRQPVRPPQVTPRGRTMRMNSESQLMTMSPKMSPRLRRTSSSHISDSELP